MRLWTVTRATWSRRFSERRGGVQVGTGEVVIGDHREPHVGYRIAL
jgi:hypothetical protein